MPRTMDDWIFFLHRSPRSRWISQKRYIFWIVGGVGGYFSEACKICTLKILLPFSTAYLKASFMKQTPDSDWWSENTTRTCRPWCFVCGTLTSCSFKYFCYIFLLLLCVLLAVFSWFGLQSAPRAQIHLEQKSFGQTGLDFPVSEWYCASLIDYLMVCSWRKQ